MRTIWRGTAVSANRQWKRLEACVIVDPPLFSLDVKPQRALDAWVDCDQYCKAGIADMIRKFCPAIPHTSQIAAKPESTQYLCRILFAHDWRVGPSFP
jgi:hypothetical protein